MSLSITGNILTGPFLRPDITEPTDSQSVKNRRFTTNESKFSARAMIGGDVEIAVTQEPVNNVEFKLTLSRLKINSLNICGIIPIVSTVTGTARTLIGLVHTIAHLAKAVFDQQHRDGHLNEAALGFYNFVRGLIEIIPVLGNIVVGIFDIYRLEKQQGLYDVKKANELLDWTKSHR